MAIPVVYRTSQRRLVVSQQRIDVLPTDSAGLIAGRCRRVHGRLRRRRIDQFRVSSSTVRWSLTRLAVLIDGIVVDGMAQTDNASVSTIVKIRREIAVR